MILTNLASLVVRRRLIQIKYFVDSSAVLNPRKEGRDGRNVTAEKVGSRSGTWEHWRMYLIPKYVTLVMSTSRQISERPMVKSQSRDKVCESDIKEE